MDANDILESLIAQRSKAEQQVHLWEERQRRTEQITQFWKNRVAVLTDTLSNLSDTVSYLSQGLTPDMFAEDPQLQENNDDHD